MKSLLVFALILASPIVNAQEGIKEAPAEVLKGGKALKGYWAADEDDLYKKLLKDASKAIKEGKVTKEEVKSKASQYSKMMLMDFAII